MLLEQMRKVSGEATEGPWEENDCHRDCHHACGPDLDYQDDIWVKLKADKKFIVMARNKIDKLLDVLEAAKTFIVTDKENFIDTEDWSQAKDKLEMTVIDSEQE